MNTWTGYKSQNEAGVLSAPHLKITLQAVPFQLVSWSVKLKVNKTEEGTRQAGQTRVWPKQKHRQGRLDIQNDGFMHLVVMIMILMMMNMMVVVLVDVDDEDVDDDDDPSDDDHDDNDEDEEVEKEDEASGGGGGGGDDDDDEDRGGCHDDD